MNLQSGAAKSRISEISDSIPMTFIEFGWERGSGGSGLAGRHCQTLASRLHFAMLSMAVTHQLKPVPFQSLSSI